MNLIFVLIFVNFILVSSIRSQVKGYWLQVPITYLQPPYSGNYTGGKWAIDFIVPLGGPFGTYDFRANLTDDDIGFSGWTYLYDKLTVVNKDPTFEDVALSSYSVYRNKNGS